MLVDVGLVVGVLCLGEFVMMLIGGDVICGLGLIVVVWIV